MAVDPAVAQSARKRIAWRILPFLFLLYIIAFLDRMNVGAAALQMPADLGFDDRVVGLGAGMFFIGYLVLEIPGALIAERWSARRWIARIMISWGIMTVLMAFIRTSRDFYVVRFLVGAAEAGFFPAVIVYVSHWFQSRGSCEVGGKLLRCESTFVCHRVPTRRFAAGDFVVGSARVAMAIYIGRNSRSRIWRCHDFLPDGLAA